MSDARTYLQVARELDGQEQVLGAAWAYEAAVRGGEADAAACMDLCVLYQSAMDPGFATHHRLPAGFVEKCWEASIEILNVAQERFGPSDEGAFWRLYPRRVYLNEERVDSDLREVAERRGSLVPAFYMFDCLGDDGFKADARALLRLVQGGETERKRYIRSYLVRKGRVW